MTVKGYTGDLNGEFDVEYDLFVNNPKIREAELQAKAEEEARLKAEEEEKARQLAERQNEIKEGFVQILEGKEHFEAANEKFAFAYVDDDDIPELFVKINDGYAIYFYNDGAGKVGFENSGFDNPSGTQHVFEEIRFIENKGYFWGNSTEKVGENFVTCDRDFMALNELTGSAEETEICDGLLREYEHGKFANGESMGYGWMYVIDCGSDYYSGKSKEDYDKDIEKAFDNMN